MNLRLALAHGLFSALLLSACANVGGVASQKPDIPVRRVILYQNGVGYFERRGVVDGDVLTIQSRPDQINDMLKSLTVIDRGKGRAVSVSLPLEKTGAQQLSELPEQVRNAGGLLDVLRVFRGARVEVDGDEGRIQGRVVGVEATQAGVDGAAVGDWRLTVKGQGGDLLTYPVSRIERVTLEDKTLSVGLDKSLDVSLNEGNWKPIALSVRLTGARSHDLVASYISAMPLWKPAYRVVIGDDGKPLLQGWAVVDNVSGEDWNDVQLSLVAGTPMSFIYDLHSPQFMDRVDLTPSGRQRAMAPVVERPGVAREEERMASEYAKKRSARGSAPSAPPPPSSRSMMDSFEGAAMEDVDMSAALESQAAPSAEGAAVGALFRYDIPDPVTIPDRSSTLVAIVNERVEGAEGVLFRPELTQGAAKTHPYRVVVFKNSTGFTLEKGPVAVYSGGTFVGESFVDRMEKGTTTFLTYSVDGSVTLASERGTSQEGLKLLKIVDGQIVSEVLEIDRSKHKVENRHEQPITAFVKAGRRSGWTLRKQPVGTIETAEAFFLPVEVPGAGSAELQVEWTKKLVRQVGIDTGVSTTVLRVYLEAGTAPPEVAKQLRRVLEIKGRIGDIEREEARLEKQHRELSAEQGRVRDNLNLLRKTKGNEVLQKTLVEKLAKLEADLGQLSAKRVKLSDEKAELSGQMTVIIRQITLSAE